jgi:hypothetical protein
MLKSILRTALPATQAATWPNYWGYPSQGFGKEKSGRVEDMARSFAQASNA